MISPQIIYLIVAFIVTLVSVIHRIVNNNMKEYSTYGGVLVLIAQVVCMIITYFSLAGLAYYDFTRTIAWIIVLLISCLSAISVGYMIQDIIY